MHLNEEELIELHYGEAASRARAHLQACRECSARYGELQRDLEGVTIPPVPLRLKDYGERVWQTLRPELIAYQQKPAPWLWSGPWKAMVLAVSCAALLATAFISGRYWERNTNRTTTAVKANPQATQRVLLVVLTDHLDRSERLLVALQHDDLPDRAQSADLQSEARDLLASNRLYYSTASNVGDPALAGTLDKLEGVLAEIANDPNLTTEDLERIRRHMNTEGILFKIRVLLARTPDQGSGPNSAKGASI